MDKRVLVHSGLIAAIIASVVVLAVIRANRPQEPARTAVRVEKSPASVQQNRPPSSPTDPEIQSSRPLEDPKRQGVALHDATLISLIQNARMAQQRGDVATRDAMMAGLKKAPERSRELIERELSSTRDYASATALKSLMEKLQ